MGAGVSAQEPGQHSPAESPNEEASEERQHTDGPDGRQPVQKNGQISGIHGNSEDQDVINGKLEQLNGLQEEVIPGKVEPTSLFRDEELEEMELEQKETPPEVKDEQRDSPEATDPPAEIGEEAQAGEIGFKKVFKFVGCKFTVKKEKPVKLEPVQLLTVKKDEDGQVGSESKQEMEGSTNGEVSPVAEEAEGSPPEVLSPGKMEESTGQAEPKPAEEILVAVESAASPVESPAVDSPLKRFFRQGFFSVLRRKPSFKKAKDEPLVIGEKAEVNGEQVIATEDANGDHGAKTQNETSASQEAAEILDVQTVEEKSERDDGFEDLTAELASVKEAKEAPGIDNGKDGVSTEQNKLQGPELVAATAAALEKDQVNQLIMRNEPSASAEGEVKAEFACIGAPEGLCAEQTDIVQEQSLVKVQEPIMGEAELLSSQEKAKLQGSPLKKLFTSSSIKKLSGKKTKAKKGDTKLGDAGDDVRLQSSTESEGSPEGQKSESPLTPPEEMGETTPADTVEAPVNPEAEGVNCATNGEAKKESITAWASFKKLVTSKKRPKIPSDSDKEDEQTDKVKSATLSSNESAASVEREEAKSIAEEHSLEQSTDDSKKKADAPVSWEALICVGSSKKRARKLSDSDAPNEEAQTLTEERGQVQDGAEELQANSLQDTDQEPVGTTPEGVASPVEDEVSGAVSTWESFKRLVTSRRKSKSKLEERADESVTSTEAVPPETESAKEESWASFKKLIPGRRKKRSDAKPEQPLAEGVEGWAEFGVSKSDEESDTPAVVPLSEYDAVEEEGMTKEQQITIATDSVHTDEILTQHEAPAETGEPHAEKTVTIERGQLDVIKSSIDERSPSWISAAVSDTIEQRVEETVVMNELVKEEVAVGDAIPLAEATSETYTVEIAEEAQEMISEVVTAPEYPAEESLTEETTEMVSAVSQLTETPVTTAEGTPIREDEALVTRQTQEVLQEAAEKVKLSVGPVVSFCEMMAASEMQSSQREPEISVGKIQDKVVEASCEMELPESAQKVESEKSDAASKVSNGIIQVATVDVQQECGKMVEQTMIKMQEASAAQSLEPKTIPPIESTASARLEPTVEVVQEVEVEVQHKGECSVSLEQIDGPVGLMPMVDEDVSVNKIVAAEILAEVETGMSEAVGEKVGTENVQSVLEETSGVSRAEDVVKPEVSCEESIKTIKTSCMEKVLPECEEAIVAAPAEIAEKMGREATEAIPAEVAEKVEVMLEQTSGAIPEVAHQIRAEKVEALLEETVGKAQEIGGEVAVGICREILASGKNIEVVCERSTEIIPVDVTKVVCNEEIIEITPVVTVSEVCGEETVNIIPAVEVTEAVLGEENVQITPVVGVTEVLHSEETIKSTPVVEVEVACREKAIKISPVVVTEIVCSEDTTKITPVVGVMEATESEEAVKINPVVEVMEVVCTEDTHAMLEARFNGETTEISPVVNAIDTSPVVVETEAAHGQEGTNIGPVPGETEATCCRDAIDASPVEEVEVARSQEGTDVGPVVVETEAVRGEEAIDASPVVVETEAVCGEEAIDASPIMVETEAVRGEEAIDASPVVVETEAVLGEEAIDASPVVVETETVCSEGTVAVGLVEVEVEEGKAACEEKGDLAITKLEEIEKNVQIMATGDKIAHEQVSAITIMQEMVETKACEETVAANMETEMSKAVCGETTKTLEGMDEEQRPKEQVVEMLIPATEILHPEPSIVEQSKETIQNLVTESTIIEVVKHVETEVVDTICNVKLVEVPETEVVESVTKEFEMTIPCVTSKLQSTATEEVKATHEGESLDQVIELVEKVGCELSTVEKDKPGPHEAEFIETPHTDGQLDGANKEGQVDVTIPKLCEATERAAELQKGDAVEWSNGATDEHLIKLKSPGELASTETSTEGGKEGSKLDDLTLGTDHEVKLHSGSIDEFHAVQSETVTLIVDPSGAENSEPHKVLFPVTAAAVEEQVLAETVVPVVTELSELSAADQVLQLAQPDVVPGLVVETAAAIVEVAIEAAAGSMVDTPGVSHKIGSTSDGQRQQSSSTDRLEGGLVEHTIGVEQRLQSLETETKLEVGQAKTFEQQSTMLARGLMQDVVMPTVRIEARVSAEHEHGQDDEQMHKEDKEKIPGLQLVTTTEGKVNEVCQRVRTLESKETDALAKEVAVTQSIELVSEAAVEGDQKAVETEAGASVETKRERKSLSDHVSEESASLPDVSKMTEVECCQSLEKPEGTHQSLELARKDQPVNAQPQAEEQTSQDVPAKMISPIEDCTPEAANEKLEGDAMESTGNKNEETDQNQAFKAVEKPGSEEMQIGHQMDQSSTVECAKGAAEKTPS